MVYGRIHGIRPQGNTYNVMWLMLFSPCAVISEQRKKSDTFKSLKCLSKKDRSVLGEEEDKRYFSLKVWKERAKWQRMHLCCSKIRM